MNKKTLIAIGLFIIIVVAALEVVFHLGGQKGPRFRTEVAAKGDIAPFFVTAGTLTPVSEVEVGSQVSGTITKINADFNSRVRKGEVLAELDLAPFRDDVEQKEANYQAAQASLEEARVALELAKKESDRNMDLFQKKLISTEDAEAAEETYKSASDEVLIAQAGVRDAKAALDSSRVDLNNAYIRSPIDGVVLSRDVSVGQTVAARMETPVLFKLASDVGSLMIYCDIDETDIGRVKEGDPVRFEVPAFLGTTFTGRVVQIRIGSELTQDVVTYTTLIEVDDPQGKLLPGMTATVTVITAEAKNVLRVPNSALRFEPALRSAERTKKALQAPSKKKASPRKQSPHVWILKPDGSLAPVSVQTGITDNVYTEIVSGDLKEGDVVVAGLDYNGRR
jgi:HlyD family secretion protein